MLAAAIAAGGISPALAQDADSNATPRISADAGSDGYFAGLWSSNALFGDVGGVRTALGRYGITVLLTGTDEVLGNVSGGIKRGATYDGLNTLTVQLDTSKALGWDGGIFNISALQIRGRSLSQFYLGNLQTVSGISATPTTRLWEAWFQQPTPSGKLDVKAGLQSIDQEFMSSAGASLYLNTMMGWPMVPSVDLYAGGPSYPLSSLGVRLRGEPAEGVTLLAGVFQDNPPGGPFANDSQTRGASRWGGNFNLRTGALFIAELQYALNQQAAGDGADGSASGGLPGTYKLGAWFDTAAFPDQRIDTAGLSLADATSNATPRMRRGNYSIYGVADQVIWQLDPQGPRALSVFARAMGTPSADRNLVDFSINAGLNLKAPLPDRDGDTFGIGFGIARVSASARNLDRDTARSLGSFFPIRSSETFIEVTYQAQVTPWLQVQPDFQYFKRPGGGIVDPGDPTRRLRDEAVFGLRTSIVF
jgi:porin